MKNPFSHIVPMLFSDYSMLVHIPMLLPMRFLPVGKGVERIEQTSGRLPEKLKQAEACHDSIYYYCSITQSDFMNSVF